MYALDEACQVAFALPVTLTVHLFDVEASYECAWDYLEVGGLKYCEMLALTLRFSHSRSDGRSSRRG